MSIGRKSVIMVIMQIEKWLLWTWENNEKKHLERFLCHVYNFKHGAVDRGYSLRRRNIQIYLKLLSRVIEDWMEEKLIWSFTTTVLASDLKNRSVQTLKMKKLPFTLLVLRFVAVISFTVGLSGKFFWFFWWYRNTHVTLNQVWDWRFRW